MLSVLRSMQLGVRRRSLCNHRRKIISGKLRTSTQVCEPSTHPAKLNAHIATVTFDFQQNLPLPHISVGDVFYMRQLWLYVFGVHECGSNRAVMYSWPEFIAGKGGNEVVSCLDNCLPEEVTGTGKLAGTRPYGKRCPLRPFTRIPCLWFRADRGETRTLRLEPSVITPYGLSHGIEYRKDEGTVKTRPYGHRYTMSVYIRLVCLSGLACPR